MMPTVAQSDTELTRAGTDKATETEPLTKKACGVGGPRHGREGALSMQVPELRSRKGGAGGGWRGEERALRLVPAPAAVSQPAAVGWVLLGWALGWKVLREKVLLPRRQAAQMEEEVGSWRQVALGPGTGVHSPREAWQWGGPTAPPRVGSQTPFSSYTQGTQG